MRKRASITYDVALNVLDNIPISPFDVTAPFTVMADPSTAIAIRLLITEIEFKHRDRLLTITVNCEAVFSISTISSQVAEDPGNEEGILLVEVSIQLAASSQTAVPAGPAH